MYAGFCSGLSLTFHFPFFTQRHLITSPQGRPTQNVAMKYTLYTNVKVMKQKKSRHELHVLLYYWVIISPPVSDSLRKRT